MMPSHFRQLADLITVGDICENFIATIDAGEVVGNVFAEWYELCGELGLDPMAQVALVEQNQKIEGWIDCEMLIAGKTILDCMEPIQPHVIMTADTPLIAAVEAFSTSSHPFFLILKGNKFIGWLSYKGLHKPPFRLCLFAMLINLERILLETLLVFPTESVAVLSEGRLSKAKEVYERKKYSYDAECKPFPAKLLECTTIADKIRITKKIPNIRKAVPTVAHGKWINRVELLRNEIAHPSLQERSSSLLARENLWPFIQWIESLEAELEAFLKQAEMVKRSAHG